MPGQQIGFGRRALRLIPMVLVVAAAAPAAAAERGYSVTQFDRIRVEGPFEVTVATGKPVSARATGSEEALERVSLRVEGQTMLIRPNLSGWGGYPGRQAPPARITLSTPELNSVILIGSGSLAADRMRGPRVTVTVEGAGRVSVGAIEADNASLAVAGSGTIEAAGRTTKAAALARGTAEIRASRLDVTDLVLTSQSAGNVEMSATRSAKITSFGAGATEVVGNAKCEVNQAGSGPVRCGR